MADIAEIGFAADTSGLDGAAASLQKLVPASEAAASAADDVSASLAKVSASGQKVSDAAKGTATQTANSTKVMQAATTGATSHSKAMKSVSDAADNSEKSLGKLAEVFSVLEAKELELSSNMGIFGEVLSIIGPEGLAMAAGLGAGIVAIDLLVSSAERMGKLATQLQTLVTLSGLTASSLQALLTVGASLGISTDQTSQYLIRFTQQLDQVRAGSGSLYDQLLKVDPALVAQLSTTKDSATALGLLAQAYAKAGASQNALANAAAGGRGGAQFGLLLTQIANSGSGVAGVTASVEKLDQISQDQIATWQKLSAEIEDASLSARNNIASIYTTSVLSAELAFFNTFLEISRVAKEFAISGDLSKYMDFVKSGASTGASIGFKVAGPVGGAIGGAIGTGAGSIAAGFQAAVDKFGGWVGMLPAALDKFQPPNMANFQSPANSYTSFQGGGGKTTLNANGSDTSAGGSIGDQASRASAMVTALGSAATASQKLDAQTKSLNATLESGKITQETYNKAVSGARLDAQISQTTLYNSSLGELATTQDLLKAKSETLAKANQQGAGLTTTQIAAVKNLTAAQNDNNAVTQAAQAGVFNLSAAQNAASETLQTWIDKGLIDKNNTQQMAAAQLVLARNIKATSEAAQVAAAPLQQLKQLELDGSNLAKQLDTATTSALNNLVQPIQDMMNGVTGLSAGFKNLGVVVLQAIQQMIIKMLIITPIAAALQSVLGGMFGGAANALGAAGGGGVGKNAKGGVYTSPGLSAYSNQIISSPTLFKFANGIGMMGEAGPEGILPLKRGPSGSLGVQMYGAAAQSGSNDNNAPIQFNHSPTYVLGGNVTQDDLANVKKAQEQSDRNFVRNVAKAIPELRKRNVRV